MSSFSSSSMSEKLRLLSSQQCFVEAPDLVPVKVATVSATLSSGRSCQDCKAEVVDVVDESDIRRLPGTTTNIANKDYVARLICLTQNHSFRPLNVTECMLDTLMYEHGVGGGFLDIVSSFYQKIVRIEEGLSMPFQMHESATHIEYMYVLRYPEKGKSRGGPEADPWAIRQSALYHQVRLSDQRSTFILISPFRDMVAQSSLVQWLCAPWSDAEMKQKAHLANEILLTSYFGNFRPYMTFFENNVSEWRRMLALGLEEKGSITANDLAHLKLYESKLFPVGSSLKGASQILDGLERVRKRQSALCGPFEARMKQDSVCFIFNHQNKTQSYQNNLEMILRRCGSASQLLEGILNFHSQTIAQGQSDDVLELTKLTVNDSATVRVISGITLVFLSFTAVAVRSDPAASKATSNELQAVVAMPLFYLDDETHLLTVSPSIWIYVAVCVPLTLLTILYWRWKLKRKQEQDKKPPTLLEEV